MKNSLIPISIFLSLTISPLPSFSQTKPRTNIPQEEISVMVFRVKKISNFRETIPILGTLSPGATIELRFSEKGTVKKVYFKEGDTVKKGDVLAELEEKEFMLREEYAHKKYLSEKSMLASMDKEYEVKRRLYEIGELLREKLEEIELRMDSQRYKMESTKKEWELAEESLKQIKLTAPADGKVEKKEVEEGEFVGPEEKAFTLVVISKVFVETGIIEKDIPKIKIGQPVEIKVDSYPKEIFKGEVQQIYSTLESGKHTLKIRVEFNNTAYKDRLIPNMFARGDIILANFKDVYVVPSDSLMGLEEGEDIGLKYKFYSIYTLDVKGEIKDEDLEKGKVKGTIILKQVVVKYKGSEYSNIEGLSDDDFVVIRSEGNLVPFATGKIINVEEYEERNEESH